MRSLAVFAALSAQIFGLTSSMAATVKPISGAVLINNGEGFEPLGGGGTAVSPGAQVLVQPGASAQIEYAANCVVRVPSGIWVVKDGAPCGSDGSFVDFTGRMNQEEPPTETGSGATPYIIGGLVVAGAVGAAIALNQGGDDDSNPNNGESNDPGQDGPGQDGPGQENPASP